MAKKSKKSAQKKSVKTAQIIFLVLGALVALSMIISSVFVFTGAPPAQPLPTFTPIVAPAQTPAP